MEKREAVRGAVKEVREKVREVREAVGEAEKQRSSQRSREAVREAARGAASSECCPRGNQSSQDCWHSPSAGFNQGLAWQEVPRARSLGREAAGAAAVPGRARVTAEQICSRERS